MSHNSVYISRDRGYVKRLRCSRPPALLASMYFIDCVYIV